MRWLKSLLGRGPKESVELSPDEQVALRDLLHAVEASHGELVRTIEVTIGARAERASTALQRLQEKGLMVQVGGDDAGSEVTYRATRRGAKLRDALPVEPRSTTRFDI